MKTRDKIITAVCFVAALGLAAWFHVDRVGLVARNVECMAQLRIAAPYYEAAHRKPKPDAKAEATPESKEK